MKILLVEDVAELREIARYKCCSGYEVIESENGRDALDKLDENVSLVITDIDMPIMDGIRFIELLRGKGYVGPIIAWSSRVGEFINFFEKHNVERIHEKTDLNDLKQSVRDLTCLAA